MKSGRNIFQTILLAIVVTTTMNCSKGGTVEPDPHIIDLNDTVPPVIEPQTPAAGQVFANGSSIHVTGKITDEGGLYRGSIRIVNDANGSMVKEQLIEIHGFQSYNYNISHTVSVTVPTDYTVTVSFEDHGLNTTTKSVKVKVNP